MLARPRGQQEHYDYDNPSLDASNMNLGEADYNPEAPRMMSSHESLDAGAVRPAVINIIPGEGIPAAAQSTDVSEETKMTLAPGDEIGKGKLKGLFSKKNKDKKEKKEKEKKDKKDKKKKKKGDEDVEAAEDVATVAAVGEAFVDEIEVLEETPLPQPKEKGPGIGFKLKGLFKGKGGGEKEPVVGSPSSEGAGGLEAANPGYESSMHSPVDYPMAVGEDIPPAGAYSTTTTPSRPLSSLLRKPRLPPPDPEAEPRCELREIPKSHPVRCSNILNGALLLGVALGILFCILNAVTHNTTLGVIGPCFLGLSAFALVGKIFITLFWQEDPLPRFTPYVEKFENALITKKGAQLPTRQTTVIARSSHYGMTYDPNYGIPTPAQQPVHMEQEPQRYGMPPLYPDDRVDTLPSEQPYGKPATFI